MAHGSNDEILVNLEKARSKIEIGGRYAHYKNPQKVYEVVNIAVLEADETPAVLYRINNGHTPDWIWVRPVSSFLETVAHEGRTVPRFTKIG